MNETPLNTNNPDHRFGTYTIASLHEDTLVLEPSTSPSAMEFVLNKSVPSADQIPVQVYGDTLETILQNFMNVTPAKFSNELAISIKPELDGSNDSFIASNYYMLDLENELRYKANVAPIDSLLANDDDYKVKYPLFIWYLVSNLPPPPANVPREDTMRPSLLSKAKVEKELRQTSDAPVSFTPASIVGPPAATVQEPAAATEVRAAAVQEPAATIVTRAAATEVRA